MAPTEYRDQDLTCVDCFNTFIFTAGEQEYYASKGLLRPKRCPECRVKKRQRYQLKERQNYDRPNKSRERRPYDGDTPTDEDIGL